MVWGWSCREPGWGMAWSEQQSMGLTAFDGLAKEEREGPDEQGKVATGIRRVWVGQGLTPLPSLGSAAALGFPLLLGGELGGDMKRW